MDLKIGLVDSPREVEVELPDDIDREELRKTVISSEWFWLEDKKGRSIGVDGKKVTYVVIGSQREERRVGFGAE